jgi:hypothetical protein
MTRGGGAVKRMHFIPIIDTAAWPNEDATRDRSNRLLGVYYFQNDNASAGLSPTPNRR